MGGALLKHPLARHRPVSREEVLGADGVPHWKRSHVSGLFLHRGPSTSRIQEFPCEGVTVGPFGFRRRGRRFRGGILFRHGPVHRRIGGTRRLLVQDVEEILVLGNRVIGIPGRIAARSVLIQACQGSRELSVQLVAGWQASED